jgi:hypothetical protein
VSHYNMVLPDGDVASPQYALVSFFDLDGAPSINMADGFRVVSGPSPLADEDNATYISHASSVFSSRFLLTHNT